MESASGRFSCSGCGRSYAWKPELSNRKVKCKCGQVMTAPQSAPTAPEAQEEDLYALKDDLAPRPAAKPVAPVSLSAGAPAAPRPAGAAAAGVLGYQQGALGAPRRREEFENTLGGETWRELYVPAALVVLALLLRLGFVAWTQGSWTLGMRMLPQLGASVLVNLVLSFGGIFVLARLLELSFGAPLPAVLKLVAICLLPPVLAAFVGNLVGSDSYFVRVMVSSIVMIPLMYAAFWWLFDMELEDAVYCVTLLWIVNQWLVMLIIGALFASTSGPAISQAAVNQQQQARQIVTDEQNPDAKAWIDESGNRILGAMGRGESTEAIRALYDLGATARIVRDGGVAVEMVVVLPRNKDVRAKIFSWRQTLVAHTSNNDADDLNDNGQKYLVIEFITRYYK